MKQDLPRIYTDNVEIHSDSFPGYVEETDFTALIFLEDKNPEMIAFGVFAATLQEPDEFEKVTSDVTTLFKAYKAAMMLCDLVRLRFDKQGNCLTFRELLLALDTEDLAQAPFIGNLSDDFSMGLNKFIEAMDAYKKLSIPAEELWSLGKVQSFDRLLAEMTPE